MMLTKEQSAAFKNWLQDYSPMCSVGQARAYEECWEAALSALAPAEQLSEAQGRLLCQSKGDSVCHHTGTCSDAISSHKSHKPAEQDNGELVNGLLELAALWGPRPAGKATILRAASALSRYEQAAAGLPEATHDFAAYNRLGHIINNHAVSRANFDAVVLSATKQIAGLTQERDLALAHDTQAYPTASAYEKVCKARDDWQQNAENIKQELSRFREDSERLREATVLEVYPGSADGKCIWAKTAQTWLYPGQSVCVVYSARKEP